MNQQPATACLLPESSAGLRTSTDTAVLQHWEQDLSGRQGARPLAVLQASSTAGIKEAVCWANKQDTALIPVSSPAGPRRHGDTVALRPSMILDLRRMDRVINVDASHRIAIIEPGLTFAKFDELLQPHGLRSYKPLLPRAGKSVLASYLEREPITSPFDHWDSIDPIAATELVFGNGELFHTGGAAMPGTLTQQLDNGNRHLMSAGPFSTEFSRVLQGAQGTLGVVCWASVYCERQPALEHAWLVGSDQLQALTDLAYKHCWRRTQGQLCIFNNAQLALLLSQNAAQFAQLCAALPAWVLLANLTVGEFFPAERMAYVQADFLADATTLGLTPADTLHGVSAHSVHARLQQPHPGDYRQTPTGAYRDFSFISQMDQAPRLLQVIQHALPPALAAQLCVHLQPRVQGVSCHFGITLPCATEQVTAMDALVLQAVREVAAAGGFLSRPSAPWGQVAFERDPEWIGFLKDVKQIFDPNNVMNPGQLCFPA